MFSARRAGRIRTLAVTLLVLSLLISPASATEKIEPGLWHIRITSQVITRDKTGKIRITASLLYNKHISPYAIGNSVARCTEIGLRRTLPRGTQFCSISFRMPLGQIVTAGIVTSEVYYKLAIVGGTGVYNNIGGELLTIVTKLKPRKQNLVFTIHAF